MTKTGAPARLDTRCNLGELRTRWHGDPRVRNTRRAGFAAAILLLPAVGWIDGGDLWKRAAILAAAGLVAGVFYQLGGIRRPGVRLNLPMLLAAWLPSAESSPSPSAPISPAPPRRWLAGCATSCPAGALARWSPSFPILAFRADCCSPSRSSNRSCSSARSTRPLSTSCPSKTPRRRRLSQWPSHKPRSDAAQRRRSPRRALAASQTIKDTHARRSNSPRHRRHRLRPHRHPRHRRSRARHLEAALAVAGGTDGSGFAIVIRGQFPSTIQ